MQTPEHEIPSEELQRELLTPIDLHHAANGIIDICPPTINQFQILSTWNQLGGEIGHDNLDIALLMKDRPTVVLPLWTMRDVTSESATMMFEEGIPVPDPYGIKLSTHLSPELSVWTANRQEPTDFVQISIQSQESLIDMTIADGLLHDVIFTTWDDRWEASPLVKNVGLYFEPQQGVDGVELRRIVMTQNCDSYTVDPILLGLTDFKKNVALLRTIQDVLTTEGYQLTESEGYTITREKIVEDINRISYLLGLRVNGKQMRSLLSRIHSDEPLLSLISDLFSRSGRSDAPNYISMVLNEAPPEADSKRLEAEFILSRNRISKTLVTEDFSLSHEGVEPGVVSKWESIVSGMARNTSERDLEARWRLKVLANDVWEDHRVLLTNLLWLPYETGPNG